MPDELPATITALQKRIDDLEAKLKAAPDSTHKEELEKKIGALETEIASIKAGQGKGFSIGDHLIW